MRSTPFPIRIPKTSDPDDPAFPLLVADIRSATRSLGLPELAHRIEVKWSGRLRSTAGLATPKEALISLNPKLLQPDISEDQIARVVLHELAHLVARERYGRRHIAAHGIEWKTACADLGIAGETARHTLPLPQRKTLKRISYICPQCHIIVRRARPMHRNAACLRCCKRFNKGRYSTSFIFQPLDLAPDQLPLLFQRP